MGPKEALQLDCRSTSNQQSLQQALRKIKPIAKRAGSSDRVDIDIVESFVRHTSDKYGIIPQWIHIDPKASDESFVYSCTLLRESDRKHLSMVFGRTIYEVYAKIAIAMVIEVKKSGGKK